MKVAIEDPVASVLNAPLEPLRHGGLWFVGPDVPIDLLIASGRAFGHLPWHPGIGTPFADGTLVEEPDPTRSLGDLGAWLPGLKAGDLAASELNPVLYGGERA